MKMRECEGCGNRARDVLANDWAEITCPALLQGEPVDVCSPRCGVQVMTRLIPDDPTSEQIGRWKWNLERFRTTTPAYFKADL